LALFPSLVAALAMLRTTLFRLWPMLGPLPSCLLAVAQIAHGLLQSLDLFLVAALLALRFFEQFQGVIQLIEHFLQFFNGLGDFADRPRDGAFIPVTGRFAAVLSSMMRLAFRLLTALVPGEMPLFLFARNRRG
jgi:hypothetical protein